MTIKNIISKDMKDHLCNCSRPNKLNDGSCLCKSRCRETCVIYQVEYTIYKKKYIGNTQNFLKKYIQQHINDVIKLYNKNTLSNSFTYHFVRYLQHIKTPTIKAKDMKNLLNISIIKKLNPILVSNRFGNNDYLLYMNEWIEIMKLWLLKSKRSRLINKNTKIYRAC